LFCQSTFSSHWVTRALETSLKHCLERRPSIARGGAPSGLSSEDGGGSSEDEDGSVDDEEGERTRKVTRTKPAGGTHAASKGGNRNRLGTVSSSLKPGSPVSPSSGSSRLGAGRRVRRQSLQSPPSSQRKRRSKALYKARGYGEKVSDSSEPNSSDEDFIAPDEEVEEVEGLAVARRRHRASHNKGRGGEHTRMPQGLPLRGTKESRVSVVRRLHRLDSNLHEEPRGEVIDLAQDLEDEDVGVSVKCSALSLPPFDHRHPRIEDEDEVRSVRETSHGSPCRRQRTAGGSRPRFGIFARQKRSPVTAGAGAKGAGASSHRTADNDEGGGEGRKEILENGEWQFTSDGECGRRHIVHYGFEWRNKCGLCNRKRSARHDLCR